MAAPKKIRYDVNWRLEGVGKKILVAGDFVDLLEQDAEVLVASGVLSVSTGFASEEAVAPAE